MPIATHKPHVETLVERQQPVIPVKIEPEAYRGIIINSQDTPLTSIIAYTEGSPWVVTYYAQILGLHNDIREVDVSHPNAYQQYTKIIDLELRLTSELSNGYDDNTGISTVTGTAIVYAGVMPNKADYLTVVGADNRLMIFRVTQVERLSYRRQSVFSINVSLVGYGDVETDILKKLDERSAYIYYFNKDRLLEGISPLVREEDNQTLMELPAVLNDMVEYYYNAFFSRETSTMLLPGQEVRIYDHGFVKYSNRILPTREHPFITKVRVLPDDCDLALDQHSLWIMMLKRDISYMPIIHKEMKLVHKNQFIRSSFGKGASFFNIDYFVYPTTPDLSAVTKNAYRPKEGMLELELMIPTMNRHGSMATLINDVYTDNIVTTPAIYPILEDSYYVFSTHFYNNLPSCSLIESLTLDYLNKRPISLSKLKFLYTRYKHWARLEQFYYGPILFTLIKQALLEVQS
jgi:hypothetical protein